ncbi:non-homologous end joining protein Ku [Streptomyces lavendulae]
MPPGPACSERRVTGRALDHAAHAVHRNCPSAPGSVHGHKTGVVTWNEEDCSEEVAAVARPVWSGNLSFGLVSLPVGLYTATDSHTIHFHQLQRGTADRIRNRRVNERTGDEVELDDIVKGYDMGGEYVLVEPQELDEIAPGRSRSLEITGFVDLAEADPIFFDKTYYLGPRGAEYGKVYSLLEQALAKAGKAGIATFVMRQHEYLVALKAENGVAAVGPRSGGGGATAIDGRTQGGTHTSRIGAPSAEARLIAGHARH